MIGQLSDQEFIDEYPKAHIYHRNRCRYASTDYGKSTINYWRQHSDGSWTNYDCITL